MAYIDLLFIGFTWNLGSFHLFNSTRKHI